MQEKEMAERNLILKFRTGSYMYGTATPDSDEDFVGVCMVDVDYMVGTKRFEQYQHHSNASGSGIRNTKDDIDITIYGLPKFLHLLKGNNPNIIELMFAPENCRLIVTEVGQRILDNVDLFVSQKAYHTFGGYAYSQLRKLTDKNPEGSRKALVDKYGYDTKFAHHLLRLYYEAIELLKYGKITLPHTKRRELLDIKMGKSSLTEVTDQANMLKPLVEQAWTESKLQHSADEKAINNMQKDMLLSFWRDTGQI